MTKSELVDLLAAERNLPRRTAEEVVNLMFDSMRDALVRGDRIELRGFGSFRVRHYEGYTGRNPKTNQAIEVKNFKNRAKIAIIGHFLCFFNLFQF